MVFQPMLAHGINTPQVCSHFECGRGSLQTWTDVDSMEVDVFLCLAVRCGLSCSIYGRVFSFYAMRLSVFCTMCVLT